MAATRISPPSALCCASVVQEFVPASRVSSYSATSKISRGVLVQRSRAVHRKDRVGYHRLSVECKGNEEERNAPLSPPRPSPSPSTLAQRTLVLSLAVLQSLAPLPLPLPHPLPLTQQQQQEEAASPSSTPSFPSLFPSAPPALAVLNSPNTNIPRTPEVALRRAIPAVNPAMKEVQDTLEEIFYLLRIPQRKPYSTMQSNVERAIKAAVGDKAGILALVPAVDVAKAEVLYQEMTTGRDGLPGLLDAITDKDPDKISFRLQSTLSQVAQLELLQTPGLPFLLPAQYQGLPRLTGRATVELVVEKGNGAFTVAAGGGPQRVATLEVVLDGYSAPLTAGNFARLVSEKALDGIKVRNTEFAVLSEAQPTNGAVPAGSLPLEVKPAGDFQPLYRTALDVQEGELPVLPLSVYGALAMSHARDSNLASSPTQFFFYLYDKRNSGLGGLTFDEGQFSVFGYVTKGRELLSQLRNGDVISSARLVAGQDRLVVPL